MSDVKGAVLVAERDEMLRRLVVRLVAGRGFHPVPVPGSWAQVLRAGAAHRAAHRAALVGAVLEAGDGADGPGTLAALREVAPALPCLFLCNDPEPHPVAGRPAPGRCAVLRKPFTLTQFHDALERLLTTDGPAR